MKLKSRRLKFITLAVVSVICSKVIFLFLNDPEGPNLLIVFVLATIIFFVFLGVYRILRCK